MAGITLVVTSGKGGVGKTTTVANIGAALAQKKHSVVLIDADIGLRNLDVVMGVENRIVYNLVDVIEGKCRKQQAMIRDRKLSNPVLDSRCTDTGQGRRHPGSDEESLPGTGGGIRFRSHRLSCGNRAGFSKCHRRGTESPHRHNTGSLRHKRCGPRHRAAGSKPPQRHPSHHQPLESPHGEKGDTDVHGGYHLPPVHPTFGVIPESEDVVISTNRGIPLVHERGSKAGRAMQHIAARLDGQDVPFDDDRGDGFMDRVRRFIWS